MPDAESFEVLLSRDRIRQRVAELAHEIRRDCPGDLLLVAVMKGAFVFLADLVRNLDGRVSIEFMVAASYGRGSTSTGHVRLDKDLATAIDGRHVVLVEDIVDTGLTLASLQATLRARHPTCLKTACLLSKPSRRRVDVPVDYVGFEIEDRFVVGYGLDRGGHCRNLPDIVVLDRD